MPANPENDNAFSGGTSPSPVETFPPDAQSERLAEQIGRDLLSRKKGLFRGGPLSLDYWPQKVVDALMRDEKLKGRLFRFVDVFPMLTSSRMTQDFLREYFSGPDLSVPWWMAQGIWAGSLAPEVTNAVIANRLRKMASQFIVGADVGAAAVRFRKLWNKGFAFTADLLGEKCISKDEADVYRRRYVELIERLARESAAWAPCQRLDNDHLGPVPRTNVSIKISSLCPRRKQSDFEGTVARMYESVRPILEAAGTHGVTICFDMEDFKLKDLTLALFRRCCEKIDFDACIVLQAYLQCTEADTCALIDWSRATGREISVRLTKGAYWDSEMRQARTRGTSPNVWPVKYQTDANFERLASLLLANTPRNKGEGGIKLAIASHNARSIAWTLAQLRGNDLPDSAVEVQKLYGMGDQIGSMLVRRGIRVREYSPIGEMISGMAYLVRRLLENHSNESWLKMGSAPDTPIEQLLASPHARQQESEPGQSLPDAAALQEDSPVRNENPRLFGHEEERRAMRDAIAAMPAACGPEESTIESVIAAVELAVAQAPAWQAVPLENRAGRLLQAADRLMQARTELAAMVIRDTGRTWTEADREVCDAIDLCRIYAHLPGGSQRDDLARAPLGPTAVITPWSSPLASLAGMAAAALVTGNPVIAKPSHRTGRLATELREVLLAAGIPADAMQLVTGAGREVGQLLTTNARIRAVAAAGSQATLEQIRRDVAGVADQCGHPRPLIERPGGKSTVIVDDSADITDAVLGVRDAAFAYAGQYHGCCSRVIVVGGIYDQFLRRLIGATNTLALCDPRLPAADLGPIIDDAAALKLQEKIEQAAPAPGCQQHVCFDENNGCECDLPPLGLGPLIPPHIFTDVPVDHPIVATEVYGPVLAVLRADNFEAAMQTAASIPGGDCGGLFSRRPSHLERARAEFPSKMLYINRPCTDPIPDRQEKSDAPPFGSPDYRDNFLIGKAQQ